MTFARRSTAAAETTCAIDSARARDARANLPSRVVHPESLAEVRIPIPDRAGSAAEVFVLAADLSVNIANFEVVHAAETESGRCRRPRRSGARRGVPWRPHRPRFPTVRAGTDMSDTCSVRLAEGPVIAEVAVPPSKSIANRALVCAALSSGESEIVGLAPGDDTNAMVGMPQRTRRARRHLDRRRRVDRCGRRHRRRPAGRPDHARHPARRHDVTLHHGAGLARPRPVPDRRRTTASRPTDGSAARLAACTRRPPRARGGVGPPAGHRVRAGRRCRCHRHARRCVQPVRHGTDADRPADPRWSLAGVVDRSRQPALRRDHEGRDGVVRRRRRPHRPPPRHRGRERVPGNTLRSRAGCIVGELSARCGRDRRRRSERQGARSRLAAGRRRVLRGPRDRWGAW